MSYSGVKLEVLDTREAVITFDMPGRKKNWLSAKMMAALEQAMEQVANTPDLKCVAFTSAKENFIEGAFVPQIRQLQFGPPIEAKKGADRFKEVLAKITNLSIPTVAVVKGSSKGGGTELALACDFIVADDSDRTKLALPEVQLGFVPGGGGCVRLLRKVGIVASLKPILTGADLRAHSAWKIGLVDELVKDPAQLLQKALAVAASGKPKRYRPGVMERFWRFVAESNPWGLSSARDQAIAGVMKKTGGRFPAPLKAIDLLFEVNKLPDAKAFERESEVFAELAVGSVARTLTGIYLATERAKKCPVKAAPLCEVKMVGVLGAAGTMGNGISRGLVRSGYKVVGYEMNDELAAIASAKVKTYLDEQVKGRKLTAEKAAELYANFSCFSKLEPMAECDMVIEAIKEDLQLKKDTFAKVEAVNKKEHLILVTNTSGLPVTQMFADTRKPENGICMHYFNPAEVLPTLEVARGAKTSDATVATAWQVINRLRKVPIQVADKPLFAVNSILVPYVGAALGMLWEGIPAELIDKAARKLGMRMGPITMADLVGLDICVMVATEAHEQKDKLPDGTVDPNGLHALPPIMEVLKQLSESGLKGAKTGKGLCLYSPEGKWQGYNTEALKLIPAQNEPVEVDEGVIMDRLIYMLRAVAVRCLHEGYIDGPETLDLSLTFGMGLEDSLLRRVDELGAKVVYAKQVEMAQLYGPQYAPTPLLKELADRNGTFYGPEKIESEDDIDDSDSES